MDNMHDKHLEAHSEESCDDETLGFISQEDQRTARRIPLISFLRESGFRFLLELFMAMLIMLFLIVFASQKRSTTTGKCLGNSNVPRFGPSLPEKEVTFGNVAGIGPALVYVDHEMLWNATHKRELHENWQKLYPKGRGYIKPTSEPGDDFEYANPAYVLDNFFDEGDHYEGYILSVFHQLHCLSIITARLGTSYEEFGKQTRPQLEHTSHCIEYLRQAILCAGDTSLEGETGAWPASAAWGQKHTCKDYDALIAMADARGMWDLSEMRHPNLSKITPDPKDVEGKYGGD